MLLRLIPPLPHPTIFYAISFPNTLPLEALGPGATLPAAWSSQLQLITSILQLEPPSSIHMLDRAVGLVARTRVVSMNVQRKEIQIRFVNGRAIKIPMNSDCVRMLSSVALDVKRCNEAESQRNSMEGSTSHGSVVGSAEDLPFAPGSSPTESPKPGKHKRQRSLLFSLISSLVPKSLSSSSMSSAPPSAPPPTPLPPLPTAGRMTPLVSPQQTSFSLVSPKFYRQRARATLADVWRSHIIPALSSQHLPAAGYAEWALVTIAGQVYVELESFKAEKHRSRGFRASSKRIDGSRHRQTQSESRNALDFGDRGDGYGSGRFRAPSPFLSMSDGEDTDRVVYPRRDQANEWEVRHIGHPRSFDEADIFGLDFNGYNDSLLGEQFTVGEDLDISQRPIFDLGRAGHQDTDTDIYPSNFVDRHLRLADFGLDYTDDDRLADTTFDMSRTPLVPSDINDDEDSDDSQVSLRTPEEGEELPLALPPRMLRGSTRNVTHSQPTSVSRVTSSRPRSRNASTQPTYTSSTFGQASNPFLGADDPVFREMQVDEAIYSRDDYLERICTALDIVRNRAREEGWRIVRATMIGAKNGWMDPELEKSLEVKAKRRAWSSGIKISAPYSSSSHSAPRSYYTSRSPMNPPGLTIPSREVPRVRGPIVPTGLSLGIPAQSSPLAMYSWSADGEQTFTPNGRGVLGMETLEGKRSSRATFSDSVTKLFPVCEDDSEVLSEPIQGNIVGFPQAVPFVVSSNGSDTMEGSVDYEDDPFGICPSRPRTRTTSMYMIAPTPSPPSTAPAPPIFRPTTPPPSYLTAVSGNVSSGTKDDPGRLDHSALLLQPLSSLSISPSRQSPLSRPSLASSPTLVQRPRAVSLPLNRPSQVPGSSMNNSRSISLHHKEHYEDLSRAYASPPPDGPLMISVTPAPHERLEQYPRYAHVHSPVPLSKKSSKAPLSGRTKEVVFEQDGSEFTVGIEVALGRAEEGRVIW